MIPKVNIFWIPAKVESNSENEMHITVYTHSETHDISEEEEDPIIYGDAGANATTGDDLNISFMLTVRFCLT